MLTLVGNSYKLFFKQFRYIILLTIPLLIVSIANIYFQPSSKIKYGTYVIMIILPLISVATDISIYRRLFQYNIINPLCNINAFIMYMVFQITIGIIGAAPIFLFQHLFVSLDLPHLWSLSLAIFLNIPTGFLFMARFNISLPLIIQNKIPTWKEFLNYTAQPLHQWLVVATLVYLPYVLLHYITIHYSYINLFITTIYMLIFICFNVTYVNSNRLNHIKYTPIKDLVKKAEVSIPLQPQTEEVKESPKPEKKPTIKKTKTKKPLKKPTKPKLKPVTA